MALILHMQKKSGLLESQSFIVMCTAKKHVSLYKEILTLLDAQRVKSRWINNQTKRGSKNTIT